MDCWATEPRTDRVSGSIPTHFVLGFRLANLHYQSITSNYSPITSSRIFFHNMHPNKYFFLHKFTPSYTIYSCKFVELNKPLNYLNCRFAGKRINKDYWPSSPSILFC
jgi:hypothetical protein